ncbi:hypothetical protein CDL12_18049 [Handroanthus impetiginosus]|uniref:Uncharacterized protein n=1 Tax=Handroanthus impetiginosus TaxID=429701 RepID=A0A2G9GVR8_9LAMI|nr:hypothetical protein CDL12_18049 [Handroanthus impetiginosus]
MASLMLPPLTVARSPSHCTREAAVRGKRLPFSSGYRFWFDSVARARGFEPARAFFPNPTQEPILKEALKEPVAFVGGIFAGLLRLDLNEEPLKEWVTRTVEASGMTPEGGSSSSNRDVPGEEEEGESPQEIEIE